MRADAVAKRAAILAAARRLISAQGSGVPFSTIAAEAGVGIATLYRHFPERDDLVAGIAQDVSEQILALVDRYLPAVLADPERGWSDYVHAYAEIGVGALMPEMSLEPALDQGIPASLVPVMERTFAGIGSIVEAAQRAGLVREGVTALQLHVGMGIVTRPLPRPPIADVAEVRGWLVEVYLRGLRPEPCT